MIGMVGKTRWKQAFIEEIAKTGAVISNIYLASHPGDVNKMVAYTLESEAKPEVRPCITDAGL